MSQQRMKSALTMAVLSMMYITQAQANTSESTVNPASGQTERVVLDTIVVTASSQAVDIREAPASITVISAEEIEKKPVASLSELLKRVPGVTGGLSSNGEGSKIKLRGMPDNYTLILVDGKRIGSSRDTNYRPDSGRQDLDWISPDMIERIEVVRGPMSSLYGSDAMGGVINIITKKIQDNWGGSATFNYTQPTTSGDRGRTFQSGVVVSGPVSKNVGLRLNASQVRRESDNNFTNYSGKSSDLNQVNGASGYVRNNFGAQVNIQPNNDHDISLEATYGVEKNLSSKGITEMDSSTGTAENTDVPLQWGSDKLEKQGYTISWDGRWANDITSKLSAYYNDYDQSTDGLAAKSNEAIVDGQVNIPFNFVVPHQLSIGGQWRRNELNNASTIGTPLTDSKGNLIVDENGRPVPSYDGQYHAGNSKLTGKNWALFLEDTLELHEKVKLTLGNRFDHDEKFGDHHSPRAYLVFLPTDDWSIKTGVAKGFRAPTIKESTAGAATMSMGRGCNSLKGQVWTDEKGVRHTYTSGGCYMAGNPNLKPEETTNYEFVINYTGFGTDINLTYFYTDFENKIDYSPLGHMYGVWWTQMNNIQKARTEGIEFSARIPLHERLNWTNSATYFLQSKNLDTGATLINTPELTVSSALDYQVSDPWSVQLLALYTGEQYTTAETKATKLQKAHTTFDLSTSYAASEDVTIRAGITNLFNKRLAMSNSDYYLEGQSAFVGMTYKF